MIRRPPRSTPSNSSAASDVYKRQLLPKGYFLVPGYGAQGATAKDIANAFNDDGLGAIVNSSRGIMCAWKKTGRDGEDYKEAARAEAIRMRDDIVAAIK